MLWYCAIGDVFPLALAILPSEMCPGFDVSLIYLLKFESTENVFDSICLVVFSLLAETPHDVIYYWR